MKYRDAPLTSEQNFLLGKRIAQMNGELEKCGNKYLVPEMHIFDIKYLFEHPELESKVPEYVDASVFTSIWDELRNIRTVFTTLPRQIIHNDLHSNNIIFRDGEPYFFDFSDLVRSPRIQDIAVSLVSWCFRPHWSPESMHDYLVGYESVDKLTRHEKECLF